MEALMMTLGSGWVSGVRPYFMVFLLGLSGRLMNLEQVPEVLQRTDLLVITAILLLVDFAADKIAGGAIGFLLGGETDTSTAIVMAVLGAASAFGSHAAKATARAAVNVSPEPVSNALVSTGEDVAAVVMGLLTVLLPALAGVLALVLLGLGIYLMVRIRRAYRGLRERLQQARARRGDGVGPAV